MVKLLRALLVVVVVVAVMLAAIAVAFIGPLLVLAGVVVAAIDLFEGKGLKG